MWSWVWFWTWKEWLNVVRTADKAGEKPWVRSLFICARGLGCFIMLWLCLRMMFLVEKEVKEYDIPCQTVQGKCANICNSRVCKGRENTKWKWFMIEFFFFHFLVSYSPAWPGTHSGAGAAPEPPPQYISLYLPHTCKTGDSESWRFVQDLPAVVWRRVRAKPQISDVSHYTSWILQPWRSNGRGWATRLVLFSILVP